MTQEHFARDRSRTDGGASVLVVADPGEPTDLARRVVEHLPSVMHGHDPDARSWTATLLSESHVPEEDTEFDQVVDSVDPRSRDEELVLYLTDMPRRDGTRPVVAELHPEHRFAMISVVGVGGMGVGRRVHDVVGLAVAHLLDGPLVSTPSVRRRFPTAPVGSTGVRIFSPPGLRRARLLAGMVRANRPWRLVSGLSKAMAGAFATGAIALATSTIWLFADLMGPWRMSAATVLSIAAMVVWLIVDHELWERPAGPQERARSMLYNAATVVTLLLGVLAFHVALFALLLFTAGVALPPSLFSQTLKHPVGASDYLLLAWLLASIATIGGAMGSGLEDDDAVRSAAYGVRQQERMRQIQDRTRQASTDDRSGEAR
ncbi:hypothetical protein [Williamsia serinedens]|uniref:Uncharacterized protein n=1 Tax=Williamsia serinedens TaxID=391736 RepID=A0ABT1H6T2_9NOCA|nr:hypothetical protein [Williamsia serinedens]MCP2162639.1 hypothetical protein [Williamsia serinedens]